ncbi:cell division protein FtsQ/DivIB [Mediterraneibacter gnavus]|nr:cell division protein FtsQ [Mediterraneibacter gnavus]PQL31294.1 cell division protein FtsQ [Mediterraneibacter gnavus ATCC 29149]QEI33573.1 cell division protein FtsQ [Mediterraneibacter gnavus ATCC 29149]QHB22910.1 cell division protein FtsQ [Mediterraneibacter gnavus ATCC 29149]UZT21452.1 cell division protein FtsQ [Mediterraneibacter gnavus]UZT24944.1 cell division protein FtsQ [Mediterraneibacter gnavus]
MKQKKKKIRMAALITVLSVLVLFFAVFLLFQTRKIEVTGNQYCQDEELVKWVQKDKYAFNSIYIWWKYNYGDVTKPAAIESVKVSIKNPWTVVMKVKEKEFLGYFDYQGEFLYFDEDGTAALKTTEVIPGAPFIEGLELNTKKVKMNKKLPVTDQDIFERIVEVTRLSNKYELSSDRLTCSDGGVNLIFGVVTVQLGKGNYEMKIAQISPILEKLNEKFAGQAGVLYLENYETSGTSVRFVPEKAAETEADEGQDAGQTDENQSGESEAAQTDQTSAAGTGEGETTE